MGFEEKKSEGPLQLIKRNRQGQIHIFLDAQQKNITRIRIHQDIIAYSGEGATFHFTKDNDYAPAIVFSKLEQLLYAAKRDIVKQKE
jgi:hypothetical protein